LITTGLVSRAEAAQRFPFLAPAYRSRRAAIREFTHRDPDYVFWIARDGRLHNAHDSHLRHPPKGHAHILRDEPDYGGFLRGRVASQGREQLVVIYCRPEALAVPGPKLRQFLAGMAHIPVPIQPDALVISDNGDLYGAWSDLQEREAGV
jgi:hypothetical protein